MSWDLLISEDIASDKFQFIDFLDAVKIVVRKPMYNRIDYSDIYEVASEIYDKRKKDLYFKNQVENRRVKTTPSDPVNDFKATINDLKDNFNKKSY